MTVTYTNFGGMVVKENRGGVKRGYVPDTQGNTVALVDDTGAVTDTWEYWPYGEVESHTGPSTTPFTFVGTLGYFRDAVSKLTYVRARCYQGFTGQWMTTDPIWPEEQAHQYASSAPNTHTDQTGMFTDIVIDPRLLVLPPLLPIIAGLLGSLLRAIWAAVLALVAWLCICYVVIAIQHPFCDIPGTKCTRFDSCLSALIKLVLALVCITLRFIAGKLCPQFKPGRFDHDTAIRDVQRRVARCARIALQKCFWDIIRSLPSLRRQLERTLPMPTTL